MHMHGLPCRQMVKDAKPPPEKPTTRKKPPSSGNHRSKKTKGNTTKGSKKDPPARKNKRGSQPGGKPSKRVKGKQTPAPAETEELAAPAPKKPKRGSSKA